jgi:hypothetical protein
LTITYDQILALAPNAISIERAKAASKRRNWLSRGENDRFLWGECKSSGTQTYKVVIERKQLHSSCNCKDRKAPCKHVLGLLFSYLEDKRRFEFQVEPPEWVTPPALPIAPEKASIQKPQEKNLDKRLVLMQTGVLELNAWLLDISHQGLATLESETIDFWDSFAARMVDAKLGSIGRKIRGFKLLFQKANWLELLANEVAYLHLFCQGFQQFDLLSKDQQADLLTAAGVNQKKEDLLYQKGIADQWLVIGQTNGEEEQLQWRKTWLIGAQSGRFAILLDYAWGNQGFTMDWPMASAYNGEMVFYPGAFPTRAIFKQYRFNNQPINNLKGYITLKELSTAFAKALAKNPLLYTIPGLIANVHIITKNESHYIVDAHQQRILLFAEAKKVWSIIALSGGQAINIFGEWNGKGLTPLSVFAGNRVIAI